MRPQRPWSVYTSRAAARRACAVRPVSIYAKRWAESGSPSSSDCWCPSWWCGTCLSSIFAGFNPPTRVIWVPGIYSLCLARLGWDPLLKMFFYPGGHCYWGGGLHAMRSMTIIQNYPNWLQRLNDPDWGWKQCNEQGDVFVMAKVGAKRTLVSSIIAR